MIAPSRPFLAVDFPGRRISLPWIVMSTDSNEAQGMIINGQCHVNCSTCRPKESEQ